MVDRRKTKDVLFYALQCAVQDRLAYADAVAHCDREQYEEALKDIRAFKRLSRWICGTDRSQLAKMIEDVKEVPISDLKVRTSGLKQLR